MIITGKLVTKQSSWGDVSCDGWWCKNPTNTVHKSSSSDMLWWGLWNSSETAAQLNLTRAENTESKYMHCKPILWVALKYIKHNNDHVVMMSLSWQSTYVTCTEQNQSFVFATLASYTCHGVVQYWHAFTVDLQHNDCRNTVCASKYHHPHRLQWTPCPSSLTLAISSTD